MAVLKRVRTYGTGVFDVSGFDFDPGFAGLRQRLHMVVYNCFAKLWNETVFFLHSFVGLHYIYLISNSLILSWILYPQRNMTYTDALFQAVSATTLCGLNTVNINDLKTYQQIFLFVYPVILHPLTIAVAMVFYRLHLYRQKFRHIEQTSKQQSRLRRAATLSHYDTARSVRSGNRLARLTRLTRTQSEIGETRQDPQSVNLQLKPNIEFPPNWEAGAGTGLHADGDTSSSNDVAVIDDDDEEDEAKSQKSAVRTREGSRRLLAGIQHAPADSAAGDDQPGIKFGALPRPPSKERPDYNPSEMYRSLQQMRAQNHGDDMDEDDGPALVIKSPRDIEADELRGIHSAVADDTSGSRRNSHGHYPFSMRRMSTTNQGAGGGPFNRADTGLSFSSARTSKPMRSNYLSWTPTVGPNSAFVGLTHEQVEELGGVEYRALKALRWFAIGYFIAMLCIGWIFVVPWVFERTRYRDLIRSYGVSPGMFGVTVVLSAFNNHGITAIPTSISDFWQTAYLPVVLSFLIMAGNVALPILLRFIIYIVFNCSPRYGQTRETLGFLLDHPRRCFMLLFPSTTTWWLSFTIIMFMVIEVSLFMILDSGGNSPQSDMHSGLRLLSAYFQSVSVRTVGFTIINIATQAPGMLVLNIIMIYVAIYPVAMSIRKSNVYEEQDLGRRQGFAGAVPPRLHRTHTTDSSAYNMTATTTVASSGGNSQNSLKHRAPTAQSADNKVRPEVAEKFDPEGDEVDESPSTLVDHMRRQLMVDIWSFVLGLLLISISEGGSITRGKYTLFAVVYEVLSAHCTVGLSMGLPNTSLSTSGGFSNVGKLVLIAVMIRGRHRGMPYEIDRAVLLNSHDLIKHDQDQENWVRWAEVMTHREPQESWLPRVATQASRLASYATVNRRDRQSNHDGRAPTEGRGDLNGQRDSSRPADMV